MESTPKSLQVSRVNAPKYPYSREWLLHATDGPEGIEIYTSEDEGVIDWSATFPAVYVVVATHDSYVKLGPFQCKRVYKQLKEQLKPK